MKQCTECGAKNTNSAKICSDCSSEIKKNSEKKDSDNLEKNIEEELETKKLKNEIKEEVRNETYSSSPEVNISTVSIDEAVGYGFDMFRGVAKYLIFILILNGIAFFLFLVGIDEGSGIFLFGIPFIIAGIILNIALSIGVMYKLWVDILVRSRK